MRRKGVGSLLHQIVKFVKDLNQSRGAGMQNEREKSSFDCVCVALFARRRQGAWIPVPFSPFRTSL
jgi:hypothetical protein